MTITHTVKAWLIKEVKDALGCPVLDARGKPVVTRTLVHKAEHNGVESAMIGEAVWYIAQSGTSRPFSDIRFMYASGASSVDKNTSNGAVASGGGGYQFTGTASWKNETGASVTVSEVKMLHSPATGAVAIYATDATISQAVGDDETLEVQWTHTFKAHASDTGLNAYFIEKMANYFQYANSYSPFDVVKFTDDLGSVVSTSVGIATSGGTRSDTSVVWKVTATAPAGATTLAKLEIYNDVPAEVYERTGLSESWAAGKSITVTVTVAVEEFTP